MHVMNKHVIVCLVNASSFGGEVFLRVSRQVRFQGNSLLDRALLYLLSHSSVEVYRPPTLSSTHLPSQLALAVAAEVKWPPLQPPLTQALRHHFKSD